MANVLYVEDSFYHREEGKGLLERCGHTVLAAKDGSTALKIFMEKRRFIDIVVTDLGLPNFNGDKLVSEIRALGSDVPTIIYSGNYSEDNADALAQKAGANAGVAKGSTTPRLLRAAIDRLAPNRP